MKKIVNPQVKFLSLCKRGKNKLGTLYKADGSFELHPLFKASATFEDNGQLIGVVYAPNLVDKDDHFTDEDEIQKMIKSFAQSGMKLDIYHDGKPLDRSQAYVAESFTIQKADPRFADWKDTDGNSVDVTHGWGTVLQIESPELRKLYRDGGWSGLSVGGNAEYVDETLSKSDSKRNTAMDLEALKKAMLENNTALVAGLTATLVPALAATLEKAIKPESKAEGENKPMKKAAFDPESIAFEGDKLKIDDVRAHQRKLVLAKAEHELDYSNPKAVDAYVKALEAVAAAKGGTKTDLQKAEADALAAKAAAELAEKKLAELRKSSNDPAQGSMTKADGTFDANATAERMLKAAQ